MATSIAKKITGYSVVKPSEKVDETKGGFTAEADRRLEIKSVPIDLKDVLYLERRPLSRSGHPSRTFMIHSPSGKIPLTISETEGANPWMFEIWIPAEERMDLRAIAKNLSMDMRSSDRGWLKLKLEALLEAEGTAFDLELPDGSIRRVSSDAAAVATLVLWRGEELGSFNDLSRAPLIDAMMSRKEPKTSADGAACWAFDIKNANGGDDVYLTLKEATLPDGTIRPVSVWMAGKYPKSMDAVCKLLSLDLRIYSTAWILRKLDQLEDLAEPNAGFLGPVPGSEKQQWYPSTVAYIATLIRARLGTLGLVPGEGQAGNGPVLRLVSDTNAELPQVAEQPRGELCGECGTYAVVKESGCRTCKSCNWSACG